MTANPAGQETNRSLTPIYSELLNEQEAEAREAVQAAPTAPPTPSGDQAEQVGGA